MSPLPRSVMTQLQRDYVAGFAQKLDSIQEALKMRQWFVLQGLFHNLAGTGTTYEMPEITQLGRTVEIYLKDQPNPDPKYIGDCVELLKSVFESRTENLSKSVDISQNPLLKKSA